MLGSPFLLWHTEEDEGLDVTRSSGTVHLPFRRVDLQGAQPP